MRSVPYSIELSVKDRLEKTTGVPKDKFKFIYNRKTGSFFIFADSDIEVLDKDNMIYEELSDIFFSVDWNFLGLFEKPREVLL